MEEETRRNIYKDTETQSDLAYSWFKEILICSGSSSAFSLELEMNLIEKDGECLELIGTLKDFE